MLCRNTFSCLKDMALLRPKIHLFKISLRVDHFPNIGQNISKLRNNPKYGWFIESKVKSSFIFRQLNGIIYQIFSNGHVNITGLRRQEDIAGALANLFSLLNIPKKSKIDFNIDNIQASGVLNLNTRNLSLKFICDSLDRKKSDCGIVSVKFEPSRFPGAFIKFLVNGSCKGTVLLFNSRKFVIVGLKKIVDKNIIHDALEQSIFKTTQPANRKRGASAPSAEPAEVYRT